MRAAHGWVLLLLCAASAVRLKEHDNFGMIDKAGSGAALVDLAGSLGVAPPQDRASARVSETTKVVAFLLIGFMAFEFALLWLVNWPDPNIRSSTWKMISSTISIYLAVLLNNAMAHMVLIVAIGPEWNKLEDTSVDKLQLLVHVLQFVAMLALAQVLCYSFRETDWLYAVQVIAGHLLAFAGVEGLEESGVLEHALRADPQKGVLLVSLALLLAVTLLCVAARALRTIVFGPGGEGVAHFEHYAALMRQQAGLRHDDHLNHDHLSEMPEVEEWREAICAAEDDGVSIVASYLAYRVVLALVSKYGHKEMLQHHTTRDLLNILIAHLCSVALLLIHTYVKRGFAKYNALSQNIPTSAYARTSNSIQLTIAMSMSWFGLDFADLSMFKLFPDTSRQLGTIIGAAILTAGSVVGILLLDTIADRIGDEEDEDDVVLGEVPNDCHNQRIQAKRRAAAGDVSAEWAQYLRHMGPQSDDSADALRDVDYVAKAIRVVITSFSLGVGSAWESAFRASLEVVIETTPVMKQHEVVAGGVLALVNFVLILPGWLMFLVPMAKTSVHEHREFMNLGR